jgi:hypothetical protein
MCALRRAGTVACWGDDWWDQLGQKYGVGKGPVLVSGLVDVISIAATTNIACAARRDGTVICWGQGWRRLEQVTEVHDATALLGGTEKTQICAVTADGTWCWKGLFGSGPEIWKEPDPVVRPEVVEGATALRRWQDGNFEVG